MIDIEKVKNLLIKLDLKYKATKDQLNANGIMVLIDFDKEYKEFNTINALDVLNNLENKLALTEKALELACKEITGSCEYCSYKTKIECPVEADCLNEKINYFKTKAKEMMESE